MPIPTLLDQYIIKTKEKLNKWNYKFYCKACVEKLGEDEEQKSCFSNKTDRIIQHLKK
ncbi:4426_t:CDS:1, partial [Racocetra fulgida]